MRNSGRTTRMLEEVIDYTSHNRIDETIVIVGISDYHARCLRSAFTELLEKKNYRYSKNQDDIVFNSNSIEFASRDKVEGNSYRGSKIKTVYDHAVYDEAMRWGHLKTPIPDNLLVFGNNLDN